MTSIAATSLEEVRAAFTAAGLVAPADLQPAGAYGWCAPSFRLGIHDGDGAVTVEVGAVTSGSTRGLICRVFGGSYTDALVALHDELLVLNALLPQRSEGKK